MNILLNPEINTNTHTSARRMHKNNVSFKGPIGDQILKNVNNITLEEVMPKLKTFFGLFFSGAVIKDVMESFIKRLQELNKLEDMTKQLTDANNEKNNLREQLNGAQAEVERLEKENEGLRSDNGELQDRLYSVFSPVEETPKGENIIKIILSKDVGDIEPDDVIPIAKEMLEKKEEAMASMFDYLMYGKSPEEAVNQIERNNKLYKAKEDGIIGIPSVQRQYLNVLKEDKNLECKEDSQFTIRLIEYALRNNPEGERIICPKYRKEVKERAMNLLSPMVDEKYITTCFQNIDKYLEQTLDCVAEFFKPEK